MGFQLPEEPRILKDTVRRFVDEEMIPRGGKSLDGGKRKPGIKDSLDEKAKALGLTTDLPFERMWRDPRSHMITEGTPKMMRMVIARTALRAAN